MYQDVRQPPLEGALPDGDGVRVLSVRCTGILGDSICEL